MSNLSSQTDDASDAVHDLQHSVSIDLRLLIAQMPASVAYYRTNDLIIEAASEQWLQTAQKTNTVIGTPLHDAVPELSGQGFPELLRTVMSTGETVEGSDALVNLMRDGKLTETYFNYTYSPVRNAAGIVDGVIAIVTEVTEKVLARKEQQKLLAMVDCSADFVGISGPDNHIVYLNAAARTLVGLPVDADVTMLSSRAFYPENQYQYIKDEVIPALNKNGHWQGPVEMIHHQSGEIIPCHGSYIQIRDEATGEVIARGATIRDLRNELAHSRELAHSEQRFRSIIHEAPVAIALLRGMDLELETANSDMLKLWGKNQGIVGKPLEEGLPEIKGQGFIELLQQVYTSGQAHYGNETLARLERNGVLQDAFFNFVYAPICEHNGAVSGIVVIATEVTEQVRIRQELEKSERRFRTLIEEAPVAIGLYMGREMRIAFINEAMVRVWGKDTSAIGKTVREALPELEGQPFHQLLDDVFTSGREYRADADRVDLVVDGKLQTFYYNFVYQPLRDENGEVYAILNMSVNVTAQQEAIRAASEAEERLRIAIDSAELGTWTINLQTQEAFLSDRIKALYGFEGDKVDITSGFQAIDEKDRERAYANMMAATNPASGGIYTDEYAVRNLITGKRHEVRAAAKVFFDANGNATLLVGTIQDITDQKMVELELEARVEERTEALRRANLSLQQSNQNLQQFAYVSSHDLQEPLRKILIFSGMLRDSKLIAADTREHQFAEKISASAQRMQRLIRDLLDYSRADTNEKLFELTDLNNTLRNIRQDFELLIQQKNAVLHVDKLPQLEAIPLQMNQLFYNLVGNALKFTKEGFPPVIRISSRYLSLDETARYDNTNPEWQYCLITLQDNGIGFDPAFSEKIFTVFQRLHNRDEYEGTGIGLALCKKIVENHNGEITVQSEQGKGAAFSILLPMHRG